jgi:hypothetical protein
LRVTYRAGLCGGVGNHWLFPSIDVAARYSGHAYLDSYSYGAAGDSHSDRNDDAQPDHNAFDHRFRNVNCHAQQYQYTIADGDYRSNGYAHAYANTERYLHAQQYGYD